MLLTVLFALHGVRRKKKLSIEKFFFSAFVPCGHRVSVELVTDIIANLAKGQIHPYFSFAVRFFW